MSTDTVALTVGLAPVGTPDSEPVTARRYHHPLLGARPVVRLTGDTTAPGEDRVLAAAGFSAPDAGPPVAAGHPTTLGYPAWALVHDPAQAHRALDAVAGMADAERLAKPKPGPAIEKYEAIAATLPAGHLPVYWEQVGRAFIAAGRHRQGALMFARARAADGHATIVDPARRSAVFLEFALAGALTVKDLKNHVTDLAQRPDPAAAYRELRELALRRTLGGLPPWPDMLKDLAKLAKAAGLDVAAEHASVLETLLDAPALWRAADGFWTSQRAAWKAALTASATAGPRLLWEVTALSTMDLDGWWVGLLADTGAVESLGTDTGRWLTAMLRRYRGSAWSSPTAPAELLHLLPRLASRVTEPLPLGAGTTGWYRIDAAVVAGLLAGGIPVEDPDPGLLLSGWQDAGRVNLAALTADDRFTGPLRTSILSDKGYEDRWTREWTLAPLRPLLCDIIDTHLRLAATAPPQDALDAADWLHRTLSRRAATELPDLPDRVAALDLVTPLATTLRAGILDELGWDALDTAAAELGPGCRCRVSWPVLTVYNRHRAIAVEADERLLRHDLNRPKGTKGFAVDLRPYYSGGQFQVSHIVNHTRTVYWSHTPHELHVEEDTSWKWRYGERTLPGYTFLGPLDQRITGHRLLAPGDPRGAADGHMFHDGTTFWSSTAGAPPRPVHLATGDLGDPEPPDFLATSLLGPDEEWMYGHSSLAPAGPGSSASPLGTDGTLLGFRVARHRGTGQVRYHRIDGVSGTVPSALRGVVPWGLLDIPGTGGRLLLDSAVRYHTYIVTARDPDTGQAHWRVRPTDADRTIVDDPDPMASGTVLLPPEAFWHFLTPRDPAGSQSLRTVTEATVRTLLAAALTSEAAARDAVTSLLPDVTHPLLRTGIVGVLRETARHLRDRDRLLKVLGQPVIRPLTVSEPDLDAALAGLVSHYPEGDRATRSQIELASAFFAGTVDAATATADRGVHSSRYDWTELLGRIGGLAVRAASALTPAPHRAALIALLRFWARSPLADPSLRRGLLDHESPAAVVAGDARLLPLDIPMHYGTWAQSLRPDRHTTTAFLQRGAVDSPPGFVDLRPPQPGWATADRLRKLADTLARREPVPFDPDAARHLAALTDLDHAAAALLLTGLPGIGASRHAEGLPSRVREALGLKVTEATDAATRWAWLPTADRLALYDAAMPDDPEELWDPSAMAARLAAAS